MSGTALDPRTASPFPMAAHVSMADPQMRKNVRHATNVIQAKRARVVDEMPDWQQLREAGKQIRRHTMRHLDFYLEQFERTCTAAGGVVHWARDAAEARRIVVELVKASGGHRSHGEPACGAKCARAEPRMPSADSSVAFQSFGLPAAVSANINHT